MARHPHVHMKIPSFFDFQMQLVEIPYSVKSMQATNDEPMKIRDHHPATLIFLGVSSSYDLYVLVSGHRRRNVEESELDVAILISKIRQHGLLRNLERKTLLRENDK